MLLVYFGPPRGMIRPLFELSGEKKASIQCFIREEIVSQMAEWLRRQIRMIIDLSDGVSPRRFKSCSGSGVL